MPKMPRVRTLMDSQYVKGPRDCFNLHRNIFCHIFWSLWKGFRSRNSFLVVSEIVRVFVNIMTPDDNHSLLKKSDCLTQPIQMVLSQNQKIFSRFFYAFPESTWNMEYCEQKDELQRLFVSQIINSKKQGYLNAE